MNQPETKHVTKRLSPRSHQRIPAPMSDPSPENLRFLQEIPDPLASGFDALPPVPPAVHVPYEPAPTRALFKRRSWIVIGISLAWFALHLLMFGVRPNLGLLPRSYVLVSILAPLCLG